MPSFGERLKNSWNAFLGRDPTDSYQYSDIGVGAGYRPDRVRLTRGNERSIITSVYNRLSLDVATVKVEHVYTDENGNFTGMVNSRLNKCLQLSSNIDQTSTAFFQDVCLSMFDEGVVAIVPTETIGNPNYTDSWDALSLRTGKITEWYPKHVKVLVYNEETGRREEKIWSKGYIAIIENPFYAIMNEPNSTMQRLIRTINNIDKLNSDNASGKLDLIIQLPYSIKHPRKKEEAEARRTEIEQQLTNTKYGIAYIDSTEHVTQLNRSIENNLWTQYQDLVTQLFSQIGLSQQIIDGTAPEEVMINYYSRTVDPILDVITKEMKRKFLSPTAISQGQDIQYFRDPFRLVPAEKMADISDKFMRNQILSSNEVRSEIGYKPVDNPMADELKNPNINASPDQTFASTNPDAPIEEPMEPGMEEMPPEEEGYYDPSMEEAPPEDIEQPVEEELPPEEVEEPDPKETVLLGKEFVEQLLG